MKRVFASVMRGAAAGAAGTTALNAVTYFDMALRGRPASGTPGETVERLTESAGVSIPGDSKQQRNRIEGLGPLLGVMTGVGTGAALGAVRAIGLRTRTPATATMATSMAMTAANLPMAAAGVSDPRAWSAVEWLADLIPHAAYGVVTGVVLDRLDKDWARRRRL